MGLNINKVIIGGRLGKKPETRQTSSGKSVANFSLATEKVTKQGDDFKSTTEWHNVVVWGKSAENCGKFLDKGSQALVEGDLRTRKWEDKDGNSRYTTEVVANYVQFVDGKKEKSNSSGSDEPSFAGDEIPF